MNLPNFYTSSKEIPEDLLYGYLVQIMKESHTSIFLRHSIQNEEDLGVATELLMTRLLKPFLEKMDNDIIFGGRGDFGLSSWDERSNGAQHYRS